MMKIIIHFFLQVFLIHFTFRWRKKRNKLIHFYGAFGFKVNQFIFDCVFTWFHSSFNEDTCLIINADIYRIKCSHLTALLWKMGFAYMRLVDGSGRIQMKRPYGFTIRNNSIKSFPLVYASKIVSISSGIKNNRMSTCRRSPSINSQQVYSILPV